MTEKEKLQKQHAATQAAAAAARRQLHQQIQKSMLNYNVPQTVGGLGVTITPTVTTSSTVTSSSSSLLNNNKEIINTHQQQNGTKSSEKPEVDISCVKEEPQEIISDEEVRLTLYYFLFY